MLFSPPAAMSRVDSAVNFDWLDGALTPTASDFVTVRWSGKIRSSWSLVHTFFAVADDGARLWVDNDLIIDRWTTPPNMCVSSYVCAVPLIHFTQDFGHKNDAGSGLLLHKIRVQRANWACFSVFVLEIICTDAGSRSLHSAVHHHTRHRHALDTHRSTRQNLRHHITDDIEHNAYNMDGWRPPDIRYFRSRCVRKCSTSWGLIHQSPGQNLVFHIITAVCG